jgi:hypothetical protein
MNTLKCSMLGAGIVALSTGWAAAAPAQVVDYLNLRSGPGFGFGVIEIIPAGWIIDVGTCGRRWCQVNVDGIVGYADVNFLSFGGAPLVPAALPPPVVPASPPPAEVAAPPPVVAAAAPPPVFASGSPYYWYPGWPNYGYYYGYPGAPYPGYAYAYGQAGSEDTAIDHRPTKRVKRNAAAKNSGTRASHVASSASGSSSSTKGAGASKIRPSRPDQNPSQ